MSVPSPSLLTLHIWKNGGSSERKLWLERPGSAQDQSLRETVRGILSEVQTRGDLALMSYTRKFDCSTLSSFSVTEAERKAGLDQTPLSVKSALEEAIRGIRLFHEAERPVDIDLETSAGVRCERRHLPIERVGLYIPGGTAPLPSTLLMLAIPAQVAGCPEITLTTPPRADGSIHPTILCAAELLGIKQIFKCGGAQAIAALAFGTETIAKVDKIFGPGNAWVTEAKMQVAFDPRGAAIDLPAGPSEVMVIADRYASAQFVASDLLSQAEHDRASQVILVSTSLELVGKVQGELARQLAELPRKDTATAALRSSRAILAQDLSEAMAIANEYAPEHLILQVAEPRELAGKVRHAGSVFLGQWTPESVGDYASGTNHVLPTYGFARAFSGVGVESFMKSISFQELSAEGLRRLGPVVECLAAAEGLDAHRLAVSMRLAHLAHLPETLS